MIIRKGPAEIERIARAGELVAATIAHVGERVVPGITTAELDELADTFILAAGGSSASVGARSGRTPRNTGGVGNTICSWSSES